MDARMLTNPDRLHDARIAAMERRIGALEEMLGARMTRRGAGAPVPRLAEIAVVTADAFEVQIDALRSDRREQPIALARQVAMHLARRLTQRSWPQIALYFRRDHTTAMHAGRSIAARCRHDPDLAFRVRQIVASLSTPHSEEAPRP